MGTLRLFQPDLFHGNSGSYLLGLPLVLKNHKLVVLASSICLVSHCDGILVLLGV